MNAHNSIRLILYGNQLTKFNAYHFHRMKLKIQRSKTSPEYMALKKQLAQHLIKLPKILLYITKKVRCIVE